MRVMFGIAILSPIMVGACTANEVQERDAARSSMVRSCNDRLVPMLAQVPDLDLQRFCACVGDRYVADRSISDLRALGADEARAAALGQAVATQCLSQQIPALTPADAKG